MLKDVALIAGGGFLEIFTELVADLVSKAPVIGSYDFGDTMGALEATLVTALGVGKDKRLFTLLGAGGLAVAVPNLVGKTVAGYSYAAPASMGSTSYMYGVGKYNNRTPLPTATVIVPYYARR